jgi:polysaccharide export outer membrane protein
MRLLHILCIPVVLGCVPANVAARQAPGATGQVVSNSAGAAATPVLPAGYVIGPSDVLSILFWRDKDMSADVTVRPDGKITLPLLNEVTAGGYTPEELRVRLVEAAKAYIEDPNATVVVKEVRSRNVFITGNVAKPASYPLTGDMSALQLIALAGGLLEYADASSIVIIRNEGGRTEYLKFNYKDVVKRKNVKQNVTLKPGDTVVVP